MSLDLTKLTKQEFYQFRKDLLLYSKRFKVSFEDAEEIVNDSILKALKYFDNEKGSFESLCKVILKNKILNHLRDNSEMYLLVMLDENESKYRADDVLAINESSEEVSDFYSKLILKLSEEELILFNELKKLSVTQKKFSISQASKNLKLPPLKGWDLFRKIQRKSNNVLSENRIEKSQIFLQKDKRFHYLLSDWYIDIFHKMLISDKAIFMFNKFLTKLTSDQTIKLNHIYDPRF